MTRAAAIAMLALGWTAGAQAQAPGANVDAVRLAPADYQGAMQPVMDSSVFTHALLEQLEDRWNGRDHSFRFDGQAWSGTDYDKLWLKSEGRVDDHGNFGDGQHELLYDRAITSYFDLQAGVRLDLDAGTTRTWGAFGAQGLALYFFDVEAAAYASDRGHLAARFKASYDLLITQRLVLQPEAELNLYSKADPGRSIGAGLSEIDAGLRLRYEVSRKFAPYIGVAYQGLFGQTARFARRENENPNDVRFVFGVRAWF